MSQETRTPGPWKVHEGDSMRVDVDDANGEPVFWGASQSKHARADARLAAAAPLLYEALKAVIENHCANSDRVFCSTCTKARAALAAADGREVPDAAS